MTATAPGSPRSRARKGRAGRLVPVDPVSGAVGRAVALGRARGGGGLAIRGRRVFVGAGGPGMRAVVVDLGRRRAIASPRTGRGPGAPAWSPDGVRLYVADGGSATLSVLSAFSYKRLRVVRLPRSRPLALAVQPGLALIMGTDASETLAGTRGADRIVALAGDDLLRAGRGDDLLEGGPGDDTLSGGTGSDILDGADGNDRAFGAAGNDVLELG